MMTNQRVPNWEAGLKNFPIRVSNVLYLLEENQIQPIDEIYNFFDTRQLGYIDAKSCGMPKDSSRIRSIRTTPKSPLLNARRKYSRKILRRKTRKTIEDIF